MPRLETVAVAKCENCRRIVPLKSRCTDGRCVACHVLLCPATATEDRPAFKALDQRWAGG